MNASLQLGAGEYDPAPLFILTTEITMTTFARKLMLSGYLHRPSLEHMVEIEIDVDSIARHLGEKAFRNKSRRATEIGGRVKVTVRPTTESAT